MTLSLFSVLGGLASGADAWRVQGGSDGGSQLTGATTASELCHAREVPGGGPTYGGGAAGEDAHNGDCFCGSVLASARWGGASAVSCRCRLPRCRVRSVQGW